METTSTQNSVIERFRPELNGKVNYPIKRAMTDITEQCEYDICDPVLKYCVSWAVDFVCEDATEHLIIELPQYTRTIRMYSNQEHVSH